MPFDDVMRQNQYSRCSIIFFLMLYMVSLLNVVRVETKTRTTKIGS